MRLVHLVQKTATLKYQIAESKDPLDYMRVAMAAIRSGLPSSNYSNPISYFLDSLGVYTPTTGEKKLPHIQGPGVTV